MIGGWLERQRDESVSCQVKCTCSTEAEVINIFMSIVKSWIHANCSTSAYCLWQYPRPDTCVLCGMVMEKDRKGNLSSQVQLLNRYWSQKYFMSLFYGHGKILDSHKLFHLFHFCLLFMAILKARYLYSLLDGDGERQKGSLVKSSAAVQQRLKS